MISYTINLIFTYKILRSNPGLSTLNKIFGTFERKSSPGFSNENPASV